MVAQFRSHPLEFCLTDGVEPIAQCLSHHVSAHGGGRGKGDAARRLRETGRFEALRDDIRLRNALDRVAGEVKRIPRELADAREAIWTPDKEKQQTDTKLWTPGSQGA